MYIRSNQATTWYRISHKISPEHNTSTVRALHPIIIGKTKGFLKHNSLELDYADLVIKDHTIVYELWHNCSFYGDNIEHNRQLF